MHIPDGYLDPYWCAATYAVSVAYLAAAWRRLRGRLTREQVTAAAVLAAGIFVAQMLNWPIPGGTSLHFVGGALAAILFGPWLGPYVLALVVTTQALVFHDGGITTLGANILNMAIIDGLVGYAVYRATVRALGATRGARLLGAFLGGWLGITLAGAMAGVEIGLSPSFPYGVKITVPVMAGWHALLGIIEGVITALVVDYLYQHRSPLVEAAERATLTVKA
ncbi:metal transporter [Pyrodictium occultum]|uniref:Metal transporter n=1 Tax=Pyrodictium occultum TaxID=2309 RepID=A0A0V8RVR4_PYROC|nr:metal transporter [Pyrodictium occultum]